MRLSLRQTAGRESGRNSFPYYFEHGRMTIGRAPECSLQIDDPERTVSKLHCTIERMSHGFVLRDESALGTSVDGRRLSDGETARLESGSVISLCGFQFSVVISGEGAPEMTDPGDDVRLSDDMTTISSILANVAPAGHMASSLLPGGWSNDFPDIGPPAAKEQSSRNVTIGWEGPPKIEEMDNVSLPADWNDPSSLSNELEHRIATNTVVHLKARKATPAEGTVAPPREQGIEAGPAHAKAEEVPDATAAFRMHRLDSIARDGAGEAPAEQVAHQEAPAVENVVREEQAPPGAGDIELDVDELLLSVDEPLPHLEQRVRHLENLMADFLAKYDFEPTYEERRTSRARHANATDLAARLDVLSHRQARLYSAFENFLERVRALEPAAIEARVTLGDTTGMGFRKPAWGMQLPVVAQSVYWRCFKSCFDRDAKKSMLEFFRAELAEKFEAAALHKTSIESEESNADEG